MIQRQSKLQRTVWLIVAIIVVFTMVIFTIGPAFY